MIEKYTVKPTDSIPVPPSFDELSAKVIHESGLPTSSQLGAGLESTAASATSVDSEAIHARAKAMFIEQRKARLAHEDTMRDFLSLATGIGRRDIDALHDGTVQDTIDIVFDK